MRILGIDPGLNTTGYGVLDFAGRPAAARSKPASSAAKPGGTLAERVQEIHDGVADVIASLKPEVLAIEELYSHYDRPTTAILMGHARGVIVLAAAQAGIPVVKLPGDANQENDHRQRPRRQVANAGSHPPRAEPARHCPSRPTSPTRWPSRCAIAI